MWVLLAAVLAAASVVAYLASCHNLRLASEMIEENEMLLAEIRRAVDELEDGGGRVVVYVTVESPADKPTADASDITLNSKARPI